MNQNRRGWTDQQDKAIVNLVKRYGHKNWAQISQKMSTKYGIQNRTGKQCRQRWHNHLDPQVNKQAWSYKQEKIMFDAHQKYGNKWTQIAKLFQGRTDNDIKNHFYSMLRRSLRRVNKILGMRNSTKKIRIIKPSVLSKIFSNTGIENAGKIQQRKFLAQALFQFSKSKQPLDLTAIIDTNQRKRLQQLIQKLVIYNQQYEASQLIKKESKKSKDLDSQPDIKSIFIINPKDNDKKMKKNHSSMQQIQNQDDFKFDQQKLFSLKKISSKSSNKNILIPKQQYFSPNLMKSKQSSQIYTLQKYNKKDDNTNNKKGFKKIIQPNKQQPSKNRGRPRKNNVNHKIQQQVIQKQTQKQKVEYGMMTRMKKNSSFLSFNQQLQIQLNPDFEIPQFNTLFSRKNSSYNQNNNRSANYLLSRTPAMDTRMFTRTPIGPTPNTFISKAIQNYDWKGNNDDLDKILIETRQAINNKTK